MTALEDCYWFVDDDTRSAARPLPDGFNDIAWERALALRVVQSAREKNVAILGGDVWEVNGADLASTYDNWASAQEEGEDNQAYAWRSCDEARRFIETFDLTREYLFVVVPKKGLTVLSKAPGRS